MKLQYLCMGDFHRDNTIYSKYFSAISPNFPNAECGSSQQCLMLTFLTRKISLLLLKKISLQTFAIQSLRRTVGDDIYKFQFSIYVQCRILVSVKERYKMQLTPTTVESHDEIASVKFPVLETEAIPRKSTV